MSGTECSVAGSRFGSLVGSVSSYWSQTNGRCREGHDGLWVCPGQGCVVWLLWDASSWSLSFWGSNCCGVLVPHMLLKFLFRIISTNFSAQWNNVCATATLCAKGWCDWKPRYLSVCALFHNVVVVREPSLWCV